MANRVAVATRHPSRQFLAHAALHDHRRSDGAIDYQNVGADSPLEALKGLHAEARGSKAVLLEGDRLLFPILPIGTLTGALGGDRGANHRSRYRRDDGDCGGRTLADRRSVHWKAA